MIVNENVERALSEILSINKVLSVVISSYDGLVVYDKGMEAVNRKKLSVEIAKVAKSVKTNLPANIKEGIILCVYYGKYELVIGFFDAFIISSLCDRNVNMGFLKIKMRSVIPKIKGSL
jgi:predicted regulator of Ras-like GTPase activity (Roadblock/LC7/MglB family)